MSERCIYPTLNPMILPGCFELLPYRQRDVRGEFTKLFHEPSYRSLGLALDWKEDFVTFSRKGVVRGMHFQAPPFDGVKLVTCLSGRVLDVVLDLRAGSPGYGHCAALELSARRRNAVYLPVGLAHGFLALDDDSVMLYKVTSIHAPDHDQGILWSSIPFHWPTVDPILSDRDRALPSLASFVTPFQD